MEVIDKILLHEVFEYRGSIKELKERINNSKSRKYDVEWISGYEFKFHAKWAVGTFEGIGIFGYATLNENKVNNKVKVTLKTNLRHEIYLCFGIFVLIFSVAFFEGESLPFWVYLLFPITIMWFWWVFRFQENYLFDRVKQHLKMNTNNQ